MRSAEVEQFISKICWELNLPGDVRSPNLLQFSKQVNKIFNQMEEEGEHGRGESFIYDVELCNE